MKARVTQFTIPKARAPLDESRATPARAQAVRKRPLPARSTTCSPFRTHAKLPAQPRCTSARCPDACETRRKPRVIPELSVSFACVRARVNPWRQQVGRCASHSFVLYAWCRAGVHGPTDHGNGPCPLFLAGSAPPGHRPAAAPDGVRCKHWHLRVRIPRCASGGACLL